MSQVHGTTYKQREIVLVPFPYSDLSAIKKRPVLILSNNYFNEKHEDILVCVITSKAYEDEYSIPIRNENLEYGVLPESSIIKTHKIFSIHKSKIIKKFSSINQELFSTVIDNVYRLIK
jgi:mRNA interferase MazF